MCLTERIIEPPRSELARLRWPLSEAHWNVLDFLDRLLPLPWEIYVFPHLNGLRPDFVVLHPEVGVGVLDVDERKETSSGTASINLGGSAPMHGPPPRRKMGTAKDSFIRVQRYKQQIYRIYCPRLRERAGFGAINAGVIFPYANTNFIMEAREAAMLSLGQRAEYYPAIGREQLIANNIKDLLPLLGRETGSIMRPELAADLRGWLVEPDYSRITRRPLQLDHVQKGLVETRTSSGYRRIRGPAGSGKSVILAARAARLIEEGKNVLIVSYNITLWHYLRDLVSRARQPSDRPGTLTFTHFHGWCREVCDATGFSESYAELMQPAAEDRILRPILDQRLPALVADALQSPAAERYDAILVDEGQDFQPEWWEALRRALHRGGEMVLVADVTQNVYGTAQQWTEHRMHNAGFKGPWVSLDVSYRLPPELIPLACDFATRFLPASARILPAPTTEELDLCPCTLRWIQCDEDKVVDQCVEAVIALMRETGREIEAANTDVTFLASTIDVGGEVVRLLEGEPWGLQIRHTFAENNNEKSRRKMAMFLGSSNLKATTLHSYKGWENRLLILHIGRLGSPERYAAAYAAITRLKRSPKGSFLTVVCSQPELDAYGRQWPIFEDLR